MNATLIGTTVVIPVKTLTDHTLVPVTQVSVSLVNINVKVGLIYTLARILSLIL